MFQLLVKDFELEINLKKKHILSYKQATLYECIEFSYKIKQDDFDILKWVEQFILDNSFIQRNELILIDMQKIIDVLMSTMFREYFWKGNSTSSYPFEAYIMSISEKFSIDPVSVMKQYTPEQIKYLVDWIIYNNNEQSKEWKKRNKINSSMRQIKDDNTVDDDLKEIREMEANKFKTKK